MPIGKSQVATHHKSCAVLCRTTPQHMRQCNMLLPLHTASLCTHSVHPAHAATVEAWVPPSVIIKQHHIVRHVPLLGHHPSSLKNAVHVRKLVQMCTYSAAMAWLTTVATVQQVVALHLLSRSGNLGFLQPMCRPRHSWLHFRGCTAGCSRPCRPSTVLQFWPTSAQSHNALVDVGSAVCSCRNRMHSSVLLIMGMQV
jgi:hypothetical protein